MFVISKIHEKLLEIMGYGDFSQTSLLRHLATHEAKCVDCGKTQEQIGLTLHHKDHVKSNTKYTNIEIMCDDCHKKTHGIDKKDRDRR